MTQAVLKKLFDAFSSADKELYLVGGAVRDLALGMDIKSLDDLDFCTNARPAESLKILRKNGFSTYDMGFEFGTVGAVLSGPEDEGFPKDVQVTTYRSAEYYRRGCRHPVVKFGDTIDQDLGRRDFSINSIAMDADGNYLDPYDGLGDLKNGLLRVIGDPLETLAEDPLRILRIGRFVARFGFDVDDALFDAAWQRADCILDISRERWLMEMDKLLKSNHVRKGLEFLRSVRILGIILPEAVALHDLHTHLPDGYQHKDIWDHTLQVIEQTPNDPALRWAALLHDSGKANTRAFKDGKVTFYRHEQQGAMMFEGIAKRFTMDNTNTKRIAGIIKHHGRIPAYTSEWGDSSVRRLVRDLDPHVDDLLVFARGDLTTKFEEKRIAAHDRLDELSDRIATLHAVDDLRPNLPKGIGKLIIERFGLKPSELIGNLKEFIEDAIIEGRIQNGQPAQYYLDFLHDNPPIALSEVIQKA